MMLWVCKVIYHRWCQNEEQCSTSATHATAPWVLLFGSHQKFYVSERCSSLMVIVLDSRLRSAGLSAGQVNVLCSWVKHFTLTVLLSVPLSIQDHKWVMANFWSLKKCWGETLSWTSNRSQMMSNVVRTSVMHSAAPHVPLLFSYHILTSSMIYYWTDAQQLGIYLLNRPMSTRDPFVKYLNW